MAITLFDTRTVYDAADTTTGWTGGGFGLTTSDVAEATGAVADSLAIATGQTYFTGTSFDASNTLIYCYLFNNALQGSWTTGATSLLIGDGTDLIAFHQGGGDRKVFVHLDGPVNWQSAVLDGSMASTVNTAGDTTAVSGSFAALNLAAITDVGGHFITGSKALGGGYNVAVDIIRYGNDGLVITGGGSGTEGKFLEIATADRSTADLAGHGVFRELQPIAFGIQAPITFGNVSAATNSVFEDSGCTIVFEDRDIADNKYYFDVTGNSGSTNSFTLSSSTITTAGPLVRMNFDGGNIDTLALTAVSFVDLGNPIIFSSGADATPNSHLISQCTFSGCGQVTAGNVDFTLNTISSTTATGVLEGAVLLNNTANVSGLSFTSGGTGHAIEITSGAQGPFTYTDFTYSGYAASDGGTGNECIVNTSGGAITITIDGGDVPTVDTTNSTGAVTILTGAVTTTVTVRDNTGTLLQNARVYLEADGTLTRQLVDAQTQADYNGVGDNGTFTAGTGYAVSDIIALSNGDLVSVDSLSGSAVATFTVTQFGGAGGADDVAEGETLTSTVFPPGGTGFTLTAEKNNIDHQNVTTGPLPFEDPITISVATTVATVTHTAHGMSIGDQVKITGNDQAGYNGAKTIATVPTVNSYTYTVVNDGAATGDAYATGILINELTTAGGVADDTRSTTNQPVIGHVRKSSAAPYFRSFPIQGTVDSTAGLTIGVQMILDQ